MLSKYKVINKFFLTYFLLIYLGQKANEKIINDEKEINDNNIAFLQNSSRSKNSNNILYSQGQSQKQINIETIKPRSYTFDTKKSNPNKPVKINISGLNFMNNDLNNKNENKIFLNKLPKIIPRLSLSNYHKNNNNNEDPKELNNNKGSNFKFSIFSKTSGIIGFKGITFNKGISGFRNTNYKIINNNTNNLKIISPLNDTIKYKIVKEQLLNKNCNNNIQFINNKITEKDKKKINIHKNTFNTKAVINSNKYNNKINGNMNIFKNDGKKVKAENKNEARGKENELKNNLCEENNDSFINELNDLFSNVKSSNDSQPNIQEAMDENDKNNESDDDKEPDPRINFEQISRVNKSRPQTSYGGLNARRKNLQSALNNRPVTSNIPQ